MPIESDTTRIAAITAAAIAEANSRAPHAEFSFMPDGGRTLPEIEERAKAMVISHGPPPLSTGPQRPVAIAPPTSSTAAPESKSDLGNGNGAAA